MSIHCPMCGSRCIRRSKRRKTVERTVLTMLLVRPFRCVECGWRFFRWSLRKNVEILPIDAVTGAAAQANNEKHRDVLSAEGARLKLNLS